MKNTTLKIITALAGLFGAFILFFITTAYSEGVFSPLNDGAMLLKLITSTLKALFLMVCAIYAWVKPKTCFWFALGAFIAFSFGGAADEIYYLGFIEGMNNLMTTYYVVALLHAIFASIVWVLSRESTSKLQNG